MIIKINGFDNFNDQVQGWQGKTKKKFRYLRTQNVFFLIKKGEVQRLYFNNEVETPINEFNLAFKNIDNFYGDFNKLK